MVASVNSSSSSLISKRGRQMCFAAHQGRPKPHRPVPTKTCLMPVPRVSFPRVNSHRGSISTAAREGRVWGLPFPFLAPALAAEPPPHSLDTPQQRCPVRRSDYQPSGLSTTFAAPAPPPLVPAPIRPFASTVGRTPRSGRDRRLRKENSIQPC